ncbi:MAG: 50S ribosomal protein L32 [Lentisphaeria bacterium]|nr:50S ribosomal protein L32 [Lentisphaeria bacterium]
MAVQQGKRSKMRVRQRKASIRYRGIEPTTCSNCGAPCLSHRICTACGYYDGKQVLQIKEKAAKA